MKSHHFPGAVPVCPLRMLVVDDDDVDRERVRRLLARTPQQFEIEEACSGAEALAWVRNSTFDCVLLDNHLGDYEGAELLPKIHAESTHSCPIIMVTGVGSEALAVQALQTGAADYLAKMHLNTESLTRSVSRSIEHHRLQREIDTMHAQLETRVEEQAATLRQRERDLRALIDNSPSVMGYWDRAQRCRFGNQRHSDWFGVNVSEIPGMLLREVLGEGLYDAVREHIDRALLGEEQQFEHTVQRSGERFARHAQIQLRPDVSEEGAVQGFYATLTDVTLIKRAQARAEELLRFSEAVIENSPLGIAVFHASGTCILANAAFAECLDEHLETLRGGDFWRNPMWQACGLVKEASQTLADGVTRRLDVQLSTLPGKQVDLACAMAQVDRGGQAHLLLMARDITLQRQTHAALVAARDAAESAARTKSTFLANMSHEIRTPMNAIIGLSRLALEQELPGIARDYLGKVHVSAMALMGILDDVLDYSKIEAGHMHFERIQFDLEEVLQRVADMFQARMEQKSLDFTIELSPQVPRCVMGDPLRLSQVLCNLVGNAIKFTAVGGIHMKVQVLQAHVGGADMDLLRFSVADTGIGIDAGRQAALFEAFVQGDDSTTRRFGGTGLGLAICKYLVEMMSGKIGVTSQLGQGSEFWFTARLDRGQGAGDEPDLGALAGKRVLVIDPCEATRSLLARQLQAWQLEVYGADGPDEGLRQMALLREQGLALSAVLADLGRDRSLALAEQLAQNGSEADGARPALLVLATNAERDTMLHAQHGPAGTVITKPVLPSRLWGALQAALTSDTGNSIWQAFDASTSPAGSHDSAQARSGALRALAAPLQGVHVLLAEDNPLNQLVAEEFLRCVGLKVTVVDDGAMALHKVRESPAGFFDAVLMDMHMPVLDGLEATRQIRALPQGAHLPIIAMTAAVLPEDRVSCIEAGMVDHIAKPVIPESTVRTLLKWVRRHQGLPRHPLSKRAKFDIGGLRARVHGNEALVWKLLAAFVETEAQTGSALASLLEQGEFEQAQRKAHDLKGSAANLGAMGISLASAVLEHEIKQGLPPSPAVLAQFQRELSEGLRVIREALATRASRG
jgi:PAS domain S-box-containing protein